MPPSLPQFLRSLGKRDITPGGSYASNAALTKLALRDPERVLLLGAKAAETAASLNQTSRCEAQAAAAPDSLPPSCFDAALCEATLAELTPERQREALKAIARALKPRGRLVLHELTWRQPPTAEREAALRDVWGAPVFPHVVRGWWDLLEAAGFGEISHELAVVTLLSRKGVASDEGESVLSGFQAAMENRDALPRLAVAWREFDDFKRYYGVIVARAIKVD